MSRTSRVLLIIAAACIIAGQIANAIGALIALGILR